MKSMDKKRNSIQLKKATSKSSDLQKLYCERMERFMALVQLSFELRTAPRVVNKK